MKVCLVNPPCDFLMDPKALPPLGLMTTSSVFKKHGITVEMLDLAGNNRWRETLEHCLKNDGFDFIGVTATTATSPYSLEVLQAVKSHRIPVVCGGPYPTLCPQECLAKGFDIVSVGDAEATVPKILLGEKGIVEGWAHNMDEYHPDRKSLDLWEYNFYVDGVRATSMMTAYGCVWHRCAFCCRPPHDVLRFHSAEWVKEELRQIAELGFKSVMIYDDEFFVNPKRDIEIIRSLGEMGFTWRAFGHSHFILKNKELIQEANKNGLREVLIGVESGSKQILDNIHKGVTPEENCQAIKLLQKCKVRVKGAFIVGLPGESWETIRETEEFIEKCPCDDYDFSILQVYAGSDIYRHPETYDLKFKPSTTWWKGTPGKYECSVSTSHMNSEAVLEARDYLEDKFKKW